MAFGILDSMIEGDKMRLEKLFSCNGIQLGIGVFQNLMISPCVKYLLNDYMIHSRLAF